MKNSQLIPSLEIPLISIYIKPGAEAVGVGLIRSDVATALPILIKVILVTNSIAINNSFVITLY